MKSLLDYIEEAQTKLFKETGTFFAFNGEQISANKDPNIPDDDYVNAGAGMIVPKANYKKLMTKLDDIYREGIAQDIEENGKKAIIIRELYNHECFYTYDIWPCVNALEPYGFTEEEINAIFTKITTNH